ncbi:uncharacterized protein AB675_2109 [Cyphellophora attinorum]|uniref:Uncharacterized protein n=1 Tax=Cyphellophora attinorum TaxID=1664694 RepID=A0A0N1HDL7_9EURO|nr:uncharacterized protein AB675_2109 [Phialophora attinorum]KPI42782.1 hypothetical protein AB675_2109 [Phialophora attinorum]
MKATTSMMVSALSLTTIASARTINRIRSSTHSQEISYPVTTNQAFELDVTTDKLGLSDYYSREDGFIFVNIDPTNNIASAAVRSVKNDVTCTLKDVRGYVIRSFGGVGGQQEYVRQPWEEDHAAIPVSDIIPRQVGRPFEMDLMYATAGVQDFYSREDGFIRADVLAGDKLTGAAVRSIEGDVVCTIKDAEGYQVRKFGGEHPQQIELSEYEGLKAKTVGCYFPGQEPSI